MRAKMKDGLQIIAVLGVASLAAALPFVPPVDTGHKEQVESRAVAGGRAIEGRESESSRYSRLPTG